MSSTIYPQKIKLIDEDIWMILYYISNVPYPLELQNIFLNYLFALE